MRARELSTTGELEGGRELSEKGANAGFTAHDL